MNDSLFDTMLIKLEDARDREEAPIMVGLASFVQFSEWMDQELLNLRSQYHGFETPNSNRMSEWEKVGPKS